MTRLERDFWQRDAETVAQALLGQVICVRSRAGVQRARIVETEAYVGSHDLASHASRGRTPRNEVMFGPAGHSYVYFVYGMHHLVNVVTGPDGDPQAVLLRGAEPINHAAAMHGPARLTKALGIRTDTHNRLDVCHGPDLWFEAGAAPPRIARAPRVGVHYAKEWVHAPLRFLVPGSPGVSVPPEQPSTSEDE